MGKDKSAQRTKGNKKPSSSGRTAELLGGATGFVGFSALQDLGYVPAASQGTTANDSTISAEFRVTLRKMTKKDSTTKIKALQEFETLCGSEEAESIKSALPFWPRIYGKLSVDVERRVREAAQSANKAIVAQVGKQLAPHLRVIMPTWVLAMVDPHAPAALIATKAFQEAFSSEKRAEVLIFTCKEIVDHIADNLFNQTPQTLSDPKVTDEEDMKSKYLRILSCSLNGLSLVLATTSSLSAKKPEASASIKPLLQNPKFWKLSKHKSPQVRSAWFSLLKGIFEYDNDLLEGIWPEVSRTVLSSLDDHDGAVLPHVWVAFLHLCVAYPDIWTDAANSKSVFRRMYSVLRDGGRGSGSELYPHLLPIISLVPEKAMEDKCNFYEEFFRALSNGICKDQVMTSSRDVSAGVKSLYECLLFVSSVNTDVKLWNTLVKYQMVELVRSSFTDKPQLSSSNLYREISQILRIWAWKCNFEESSRNLHDLIDLFWVSFLLVCEAILEVGNEVQLAKAVDFFLVLKTPTSKFSSMREGVKFSDEKLNCELPEGGKSKWSNKEKEKLFLEMTSSNLAPFTLMCYKCYQKDNNINVYNIFAILLSSFPSSRLYSALLYGAGEEKFVRELDVVQKLILPKLEEDSLAIINPSVNMFLSLYSLMEPREQETILKSLKQSLSIGALRLLVEKMTERRESDPVAAAWLLSSQLGSFLVQLIDILCCPERSKGAGSHSGQQDELISLFNFVLRNGNKKEPVISMDYVSEILMKMTLNLKAIDADTEPEDQMVQLVANLAGQLFSSYVCWQTNGIQEFMRSLFLLLCQSSKSLCGDTVEILKATFLKAFRGLITFTVENSPEKLLHEEGTVSIILKDIKQIVMEDSSTFGLTLTLSELVHHLFVVVYERVKGEEESSIMLDHSKIQTMLNILIPSENDWTEIENTLCPLYVAPAILQGTISFREFPFPRNMQEDLTWNQKHTRISLFLCELLLVLCHCEEYQTDDTKEEVYLGQYTCLAVVALHSTCHSTSMMDLLEASHN
ncbi:listerin E3 ubiquitin protein ligase 1, partial [Halocaridina rubra]